MKKCLECESCFDSEHWKCPKCGFQPQSSEGFQIHCPEISKSQDGYNPDHFDFLFALEDRNFWFRSRNKLIQWVLRSIMKAPSSFLEIGCGTGYVLRGIQSTMPTVALAGSEIFVEGLRYSRERLPGVTLMQMDALKLPFVEEYECIGAFDVLEHIADDVGVLRQIHQALKPLGFAVFTVPQHKFMWSNADESACHERRYSRGELERKCLDAGFRVVKSTSFVSLLLPIMYLSRRLNSSGPESLSNANELNVNPFLNEILYVVLILEHLLIRIGVSLPLGGSRLVVCQKPT